MSLFGNKEPVNCDVCGKDAGPKHSQHKAKDGVVCDDCFTAAGFPVAISFFSVPVSLIQEQIESDDGLSIVKRFKQSGGTVPEVKKSWLDELADEHNKRMSEPVKCPKCGSEQISADKKGFGVGKAVVGAAFAGPIGLMGGNIGSKKVRITCLKCGNSWMAGRG